MMTNSHHTVLYTGVTGNIARRGWQHKQKMHEGFTKRYNATKMVYVEAFRDINKAIAREKQIKRWTRKKKNRLVDSINPDWRDLYEEVASR